MGGKVTRADGKVWGKRWSVPLREDRRATRKREGGGGTSRLRFLAKHGSNILSLAKPGKGLT